MGHDECSTLCCTRIENFNVSFASNKIIDDVNLHIHCGELTAIIGRNGAGKSTLLKAMLGEIPFTGTMSFLDEKGLRSGSPLIGYVPQHLIFDTNSPVSVCDLFEMTNSRIPICFWNEKGIKETIIKSLSIVKADHLFNRKLGTLSAGELQRVLLALALDPIPDLLLLDEPVSGIDQSGLDLFYHILNEIKTKYDLSIILVSHDLDYIRSFADRVILLDKTVLLSGTPDEVFASETTAKTFGMAWLKDQKCSFDPPMRGI
ncbi:MAG: metal ABC transporter ATP-binding protein [Saccharofermentanales bacterium]